MNNNDYFEREEEAKGKAVLLMLVFGLLAAAIGSVVYAVGVYYIPSTYLKIVMIVLFGALIGKATLKAASLARCTNRRLVIGITILLVIFAEYFNWVSTLYFYKEIHVLRFGIQDILSWMKIIAQLGFWEWNRVVIKGWMAWASWALEFAGILLTAIYVVAKEMEITENTQRFIDEAMRIKREKEINGVEYNNINNNLQQNNFNEREAENPINNINETNSINTVNNTIDNNTINNTANSNTQYYGQPDNDKLESYLQSFNDNIEVSSEEDNTF